MFFFTLRIEQFSNKAHVPYMNSALNMDTPNNFKSNKFYRHMALHIREEKQLRKLFSLERAKKRAVHHFEGNLCFHVVLIVITGKFKFLLGMVKLF